MSKRTKKRKKREALQFIAAEVTRATPLPVAIWRKVAGFIKEGGTPK